MVFFPALLMAIVLATLPRFWAVNKPAGWWTIPGRMPPAASNAAPPVLIDWVRSQLGPAWVVHRLDRGTSGVVLFARDEEAHREANGWFEQHKVKKQYRFLASGAPAFPSFQSSEPIEGKPSRTLFASDRALARGEAFLGTARPQSGRRHQIRIHLANLGHPILGDSTYGGTSELVLGTERVAIPRTMLHASLLELPTGERIEAPLPEDFSALIERLGEAG